MSNMSPYYHNRSTDKLNKHNRYQLVYDDRNRPDDNQQRLWLAKQASCELLYRLNRAIGDTVKDHSVQEHEDRCLRLDHLVKIECRNGSILFFLSLSDILQACCRRLESLFSIHPSIGTFSFSEVKTAFIKFMYCLEVSLVV